MTGRVAAVVAAGWVLVALAGTVSAAEAGGPAGQQAKLPGDWQPLWARQADSASAAVDDKVLRDGRASIRVEHTGPRDWSLSAAKRLDVSEGDILELTAWLRVTGTGSGQISVVTLDAGGKTVEWLYGAATARAPAKGQAEWRQLRSRVIVPAGVSAVQPRLTGDGPATVWMQDFTWKKAGSMKTMMDKDLPASATIGNDAITVTFRTADATLEVLDRRTGKAWRQKSTGRAMTLGCAKVAGGLDVRLMDLARSVELTARLRVEGAEPELTVTIAGNNDAELPAALVWPAPFVTDKGTYLVVPMNEGISYPVDDQTIRPMHLVAYGGHGICMPFWGVTDGDAGQMAILETPDDASIGIERTDGLLNVGTRWEAQKGHFGYDRRVRYVFLAHGGHVAMCKRYRAYAAKTGLLKTLADKRKDVPAVDLLVGAVNVWCWDRDSLAIVKEMQAAGIQRILWSNQGKGDDIRAMNELPGVLTSRYDIYQDVMDPAMFPRLQWTHGDWPTSAWPKDLMIDWSGNWVRGWEVETKDGGMIPCGTLCDRQAPPYAEKRIATDLKDHPYRSRFIDTTTASPWRECYDPNHPMTRSDSKHWKMELLAVVSGKFKLVTGCETGHDASVPYLHYFEGMLSLGPYRVPDSGRVMLKIWDTVPPDVAKFQLGHRYRLPLWELVYHDCVVAQWYWGDYNNKLPSLWDKRDLFNALYGTPPMFMFNRQLWQKEKARFVQSYQAATPVARAAGYAEMTDHRFLTPDRDVQQTTFANGVTVTVNFGEKPYEQGELKLAPMGSKVTGITPTGSAEK